MRAMAGLNAPIRTSVALVAMLVMAGCQTPKPLHTVKQPWFALGEAAGPIPAAIVARPGELGGVRGALSVNVQGELNRLARRVQAVIADVEKVVVTVKPNGGAEVSQTVLKGAINLGQTTVTFAALPVGEAIVTVAAFDVAGNNIGSSIQYANVTAGQVSTVSVALQLSPTVTTGSSGAGTGVGGLATNVSIVNLSGFINSRNAGMIQLSD